MELESLKYIWRSMEPPPVGEKEKDRHALLILLQKRSRGPVARMRRNLIWEASLMVVTYIPAMLVYILEFEGRLSAISLIFGGVAVLFFMYYYRKYRLLNEMDCVTCQVRSNLARQVATLKKYTRFYLLFGTGMIPATYLLSYAIIRWKLPAAGSSLYYQLHPAPWWANPVVWLIAIIFLTIGIYYINAWYINKLYGKHIKKLQELLQEMEAE